MLGYLLQRFPWLERKRARSYLQASKCKGLAISYPKLRENGLKTETGSISCESFPFGRQIPVVHYLPQATVLDFSQLPRSNSSNVVALSDLSCFCRPHPHFCGCPFQTLVGKCSFMAGIPKLAWWQTSRPIFLHFCGYPLQTTSIKWRSLCARCLYKLSRKKICAD